MLSKLSTLPRKRRSFDKFRTKEMECLGDVFDILSLGMSWSFVRDFVPEFLGPAEVQAKSSLLYSSHQSECQLFPAKGQAHHKEKLDIQAS
jgi:hypothetical protein